MNTEYNRILLKVSGEALADKNSSGISDGEVDKLAYQLKCVRELGVEAGVVVGGGNFWRGRQNDTMDRGIADYIGMMATVMNSLALSEALTALEVPSVIMSALAIDKVAKPFVLRDALEALSEKKIVIFAAGTGSPYFSTDTAAVLRACEIHADAVLCAKNVDGVYDKDPRKFPDAKKYEKISYDEMILKDLKALDLTAVAMCKEYNLKVVAFDKNVENGICDVVLGKKMGTIIE